jgi:CubicO group peptidase (beta-lactamase class C family)
MSIPQTFAGVAGLLDEAVRRGAFPCAVAEVGTAGGCVFSHAVGRLWGTDDSSAASCDTIFDLASLTKVVATTTLAARACAERPDLLDSRVSTHIEEWRGRDRQDVRVSDLLAHQSGLTAHLPYYRDCDSRTEYRHSIATQALEYPPRSRSVYSDLGFILLGFILEGLGGVRLDVLFDRVRSGTGLGDLRFLPPTAWRHRTAPTGVSVWRRRTLIGEVNDDNCWALGGVAGHAGVFGTAPAVGRVARTWLRALAGEPEPDLGTRRLARLFAARVQTPGSSRAMGWDTMLPTSSCGPALSTSSIGHTGFTGTSLWIDWERDAYFVLLTNRLHPSGDNDDILRVRPAFHTAAVEALERWRAQQAEGQP